MNNELCDARWCVPVVIGLVLLNLIGMIGCDNHSQQPKILVFAAASSNEAISEICKRFESQEHVQVRTSFASSSTLATQILNGAQADLFLSANLQWVDRLESSGAVHEFSKPIGNQLVVITALQNDSTWKPERLEDLADDRVKRIAIADPDSVPAGIYAKTVMDKLDIWIQTKRKFVYGTDVRQTLAQVECAAVDFGIVYQTDAKISSRVQVVFEIPLELSGPIDYGLVLTVHGHANPQSRQLFEFITSEYSKRIFEQCGFRVTGATSTGATK